MAFIPAEDLFRSEIINDPPQRKNRFIPAEDLTELDLESDIIARTLRAAGFHPDDTEIIKGVTPEAREALRAQRQSIAATSPSTVEDALRQQGIDPSILEAELTREQEDRVTQGLDIAREFQNVKQARSLEAIRVGQIEQFPRLTRPFISGLAQSTLRSASLLARTVEGVGLDIDVADELSREAGRVATARKAINDTVVESAVEGAVSSMADMFIGSGMGLGVNGLALAAGASATNSAITEGKDAGLKGMDLATFAIGQGTIEAGTTIIFGKVFGEGLEGAFVNIGKDATKRGILNGLKQVGINTLAELPEEITIEVLQSAQSVLQGVDPTALDRENLRDSITQVTLATLFTAGMVQGLNSVSTIGAKDGQEDPDIRSEVSTDTEGDTQGQEGVSSDPTQTDILQGVEDTGSDIRGSQQDQRLEGELPSNESIEVGETEQAAITDFSKQEPLLTEEATEAEAQTLTTGFIREEIEATPNILTPSQVSKLVTEGGEFQPAKLPRRGGRLSKAERSRNRDIFVTGAARGKRDLNNLKAVQTESDLGSGKADLLDITQRLVPEDATPKLVEAINNVATPRQFQTVRGRVQKAVEATAKVNAQDRIKAHGKGIDFAKIPFTVEQSIGKERIAELKKEVTKPSVVKRDSDQLNAVADELARIEAEQAAQKELLKTTKHNTLNELSSSIRKTAKEAGADEDAELKTEGTLSVIRNQLSLHPEDLMINMDGGEQGPLWQSQYKAIKEGSNKQAEFERSLVSTLESTVPGFEDKRLSWSRGHAGRAAETIQVNVSGDQSLELTKGEAVTLLSSLKVQDNRKALVNAGMKLDRTRAKDPTKLDEGSVTSIQFQLESDPEINQMAEDVIEYLNGLPKSMYDKAHVELNGFSNILARYFPLARDTQERLSSSEFDIVEFMKPVVSQIGASKTRVSNRVPVLITDIFGLIDRHNRQVAGFAAMGRPLQMANLVLKQPDTIKGLDSNFGKGRRKFLQDRLSSIGRDVLGVRSSTSRLNQEINKALQRITRGVLSANVFSGLKQIPSMALANTQGVSVASLARSVDAMNPFGAEGKAVRKRMMQSGPVWKRYNNTSSFRLAGLLFDSENRSHIEALNTIDSISEKMMGLLTAGDQAALSGIWKAIELDNPNFSFEQVESKFLDVISRTQPVTELVDMTGLAIESKANPFAKLAFTLFSNQRAQNLNMIRRALRLADKEPVEALKQLTLLAIMIPAFITGIDELRRFIYGHNEDKTGDEITQDFLFEIVKNNIGNVYGADIAVDVVEDVKRRVKDDPTRLRGRTNIISSTLVSTVGGLTNLAASFIGEDGIIKSGPMRGQSKDSKQFKEGLTDLSVGLVTLMGGPGSIVRTAVGVGENSFESDYSVWFKKRSALKKLDKKGKLSDSQQEQLAAIDNAMVKANLTQRSMQKGIVSADDGNAAIATIFTELNTELESISTDRLAGVTVAEKEELKDEQATLEFNSQFGVPILELELEKRDLSRLVKLADTVVPRERRGFLKNNPDIVDAISRSKKIKVTLRSITRLKKILVKPNTSSERRRSLQSRINTLLKRAKDDS